MSRRRTRHSNGESAPVIIQRISSMIEEVTPLDAKREALLAMCLER